MAPTPSFERLWPTLFMSLELPGHVQANPVLEALILAEDAAREDLTGDYLAGDLLDRPHPALGWLRQCVSRAVLDYAAEAGVKADLDWSLQAWANVNMRGDYHNLHNHPHSWLSGTYYVAVPAQPADTHRRDLDPGAISFYDPRAQANMTAIFGDGQFDPEYRRLPRPGELFLWPSFLHHLVHPNLAEAPRVSISFNIVLRMRASYLAG